MLGNIVKQEIVFYAMSALLVFGVIAKIISVFTVGKMVKAASEIQKSNHRLMKLIKAKFEHASMISDKVQNVEAFVDKYMYEYKVWGVRLHRWRALPKKVLWMIAILGIFAIFESYRMEGLSDLFSKYVQWTGIYVLFLALLYFVAEENSRIQAARTYMVEYLENVCIHRYEKMHKEIEKEEEPIEEAEEVKEPEEEIQIAEQLEEERKRSEQEMRIRAILEEFLA